MNKSLNSSIKAILFDLDGTLLDINLKLFIPQYVKMLGETIAHLVSPKKFIASLMKATKVVEKNNGRDTNENVFAEVFFPLIGYSRQEIDPIFKKFYEQDFLKLRQYARRKPEARSVVQAVFNNNYDVVIATTPLLPATTIEQRLEWAGVNDFSYRLITTFENSRASKPNLLYYKQILEIIGHPPEACLMVGDEDRDMVAAHLGIPTFLVPSPYTNLGPEIPVPTYKGKLADLKPLLKKIK